MKGSLWLWVSLVIVSFSIAIGASSDVSAQSAKTFVSSAGADNGACTATSPCQTMSAAVAAVQAGGEVFCLTSGGFGSVTITKSVSIFCDNVNADLAGRNGADAIAISAGGNDKIVLQGLHISGFGTGRYGVLLTAGTLFIDHCHISGFQTGVVSSGSLYTTIKNSTVFGNNAGIQFSGIVNSQNPSFPHLAIVGSSIVRNSSALLSSNYNPYLSIVSIEKSQIHENGTAFDNMGGSKFQIAISDSSVVDNSTFSTFSSSSISSYGNNIIAFNGGATGANTSGFTYVGPQ